MHERVQPYQETQAEFALLREGLGVSGINHILRVHGHTILQERQGPSRERDSFQDLQRTAWNMPRSQPADRVLGTRGRGTLPAPHALALSLQPNRGFWT